MERTATCEILRIGNFPHIFQKDLLTRLKNLPKVQSLGFVTRKLFVQYLVWSRGCRGRSEAVQAVRFIERQLRTFELTIAGRKEHVPAAQIRFSKQF